jgi:nicotinamide-nucleotide amidase
VHAALRAQGATVAVAESLTGGLLAAALVDVPGASATFRGSVTAYATELKASVLGVDEGLLAVHGPVHPVVARQMADGVRRLLGATYGLATTGVAGPDAQDGLPVGTVHVGFAGPGGTQVVSPVLSGPRARIRGTTVTVALELLLERLASPSRPR